MRYAKINSLDISNGESVGVAIFVQGCPFHCRGCFNEETWDFNGGKEWNEDVEKKFIELISKPYVKRVSILGGEPLANQNLEFTYYLMSLIVNYKPNAKIWLYTGYTFENIIKDERSNGKWFNILRYCIMRGCNYFVDGQFDIDKQDLTYSKVKFAGSTNQRIIDVQKTIQEKQIVLWEESS